MAEVQGLIVSGGACLWAANKAGGGDSCIRRACSPSLQRPGMGPGPPHLCISMMTPPPSRKKVFIPT